MTNQDGVLIIGAGPAGLTAAYELARYGRAATILEADPDYVGGISRTVEYKGYRFDIGGHRFFSKSREIVDLWEEVLGDDLLTRPRLSRWLYNAKFFDYPIRPVEILRVFGPVQAAQMVLSYLRSRVFPVRPEISLADYYVNRFGRFLAFPFFIRYNERLWGLPCGQLSPDFAKQRVKGISLWSAVMDPIRRAVRPRRGSQIKSFVAQFRYPRLGPGMMWEAFRDRVLSEGCALHMGHRVVRLQHDGVCIERVLAETPAGDRIEHRAAQIISSMPLRRLVLALDPPAPAHVLEAAQGLRLRDFITVALIVARRDLFPDQWVYLHDRGMRPIRMQNFNNWSPHLVPDPATTCLGFEYVCSQGDALWQMSDPELIEEAKGVLARTGFARHEDVIDGAVVRSLDVYPVYTLDYRERVETIRGYLARFHNLLPYRLQAVGRAGMHRYNNSDHSMMTGLLAARNILGHGEFDPWLVNTDAEYHEEMAAE